MADVSDAVDWVNQKTEQLLSQAHPNQRVPLAARTEREFRFDLSIRNALLPSDLLEQPIWRENQKHIYIEIIELTDSLRSAFWREWYQGFLDGKPLPWEFQRRVALIPDEDWEQGPEHIAEKIEKIREDYAKEQASKTASEDPRPASESEKQIVKEKVSANREALALSIASLVEQFTEFRERVRGLNHLEPDFKTELLEFIDNLSSKLETLLHDLPTAQEEISDEKANRLVLWLREFRPLVTKNSAKYIAPENVAEATVPTAIILGCTSVGTMVGGPAGAGVGALVGSLITGQIKPAKAAAELTQPDTLEPPTTDT